MLGLFVLLLEVNSPGARFVERVTGRVSACANSALDFIVDRL